MALRSRELHARNDDDCYAAADIVRHDVPDDVGGWSCGCIMVKWLDQVASWYLG